MYVNTVDTKHVHTFLPITLLIFNQFSIPKSFEKLRLRAFQPHHQMLCVLTLSMQVVSISNALNAMYVKIILQITATLN